MGALICNNYDDSADVLTAMGGLMMGLIRMQSNLMGLKFKALGGIINYVGDMLKGLNREYGAEREKLDPRESYAGTIP